MKNIFKTLALAAAILFTSSVNAQTTNSNSLLWKVSGNGLEKPSYLFGTIHMICESDFILHDKVTTALSNTNQLILELNFGDPKEMETLQMSAITATPLSERLTPEQYHTLEVGLKDNYNLDIKKFENFTLETIGSLITFKAFNCENFKMYEVELMTLAAQQQKSLIGLETVAEQMSTASKALGSDYLFNMLANKNDYATLMEKTIAAYKSEHLQDIYNEVNNPLFTNPENGKIILNDRNQNWLKKLPALMKEKSAFIAVGSAHLAGEQGLINLLIKAGYSVTPVMN